MTGRPPTTIEGRVKSTCRTLRQPAGAMRTIDRIELIAHLHAQVSGQARYTGEPDPDLLVRLAAHCIVWAEEAPE